MSVLNHILAQFKRVSSSPNDETKAVYPAEDFEKDVMEQITELKQTIRTMGHMIVILQQQNQFMQTQLNQFIYGSQYSHCSVSQGNTTTITNNYYGNIPEAPYSEPERTGSMYPRKGDYRAVAEWLEARKAKGEDFYAAANYNRSEMCRRLSDIFGWVVDESGVRKAQAQKM